MYSDYAEIEAFFWDELGCNYINKEGEVVSLYEKLDETNESFIKDNSTFISINQMDEIKKFAKKILKKREKIETITMSLQSFSNLDCFYRDKAGICFVTKQATMRLTYSDSDTELVQYAKNYMPYLNNEEDIINFTKKCRKKYGWADL